jgi:hypothetical protein
MADSVLSSRDRPDEVRVSIVFASGTILEKLRSLYETEAEEFHRYARELARQLGVSQPPMDSIIWDERLAPTLMLRWKYETMDTVCSYFTRLNHYFESTGSTPTCHNVRYDSRQVG